MQLQRLREQHGQQTARLRSVERKLARVPKATYAVRYAAPRYGTAAGGRYSDDDEPSPPGKLGTRASPPPAKPAAAAAAAAAVAAAAGAERAAVATVLAQLGAMGREQLLLVARGTLDALPPAARHELVLEQAAELLRGAGTSESGAAPPLPTGGAASADRESAEERPRTAPAKSEAEAEAISRANYTASGLGLFTIPLMGSRAAGLPGDQLSNIEAATLAATMRPTSSLSALMSTAPAPAPALAPAPAPAPTEAAPSEPGSAPATTSG